MKCDRRGVAVASCCEERLILGPANREAVHTTQPRVAARRGYPGFGTVYCIATLSGLLVYKCWLPDVAFGNVGLEAGTASRSNSLNN